MSDPKQVHIQGDVNISPGLDTSLGLGFLYIPGASGGLDVNGATTLDQVTIDTTDAEFAVTGSNKVNFSPAAAIELTAGATSFFTTKKRLMFAPPSFYSPMPPIRITCPPPNPPPPTTSVCVWVGVCVCVPMTQYFGAMKERRTVCVCECVCARARMCVHVCVCVCPIR